MAAHSNILAWEIHGKRSQEGYTPWSHKRARHDLVTKQKLTTLPRRTCRFKAIPVKIQIAFFFFLQKKKVNLKFIYSVNNTKDPVMTN